MDLDIGGKPAGRVVLGLFGKEAPNTVDNFLRLVEGRGQGGATYVYSSVFRVEKVGGCMADPLKSKWGIVLT
jgi:cyclophilin family peptidyl-prolyl cis-trans isomerase